MKILIACEFSGVVRNAFNERGHEAVSCDFLPSETPGPHHQGDVREIMNQPWDMMIAHPPCTYMANSGAKHLYIGMKRENGINPERWANMVESAEFFRMLWDLPISRIIIENPIMLGCAKNIVGSKQSQTIQPWQHGHGETKATCLWLRGLPLLMPTHIVPGRIPRVHFMPPSTERWKMRSTTLPGIARAFAEQWG